ncbi:RNA-binding cell elongation regulator Jag/EloR [Aerococcus urinaeequi]|uniref:RNA-binding cell elongation regulator Jag/EloR n=1 Tax=Aerococcus urinaeequi TaxID=51665 RepID=UPI00288E5A3E|nr:RNA-binding cell elongation regulator Jag/EloR [Aerococcus urinaeequi]MDT2761886.1 RNA-binding cell elongation regulator Jag/EloR [Aerococcus urinaeequi]
MKTERFEATSVDAAIAKGLQQLRLAREDVEVQVIQEAKKGFLGLGAKDAIVAIHYTEREVSEIDATTDNLLAFSDLGQENTSAVAPSEDLEDQPSENTDTEINSVTDEIEEEVVESTSFEEAPETQGAESESEQEVEEELASDEVTTEKSEPSINEETFIKEATIAEVEVESEEAAETAVQADQDVELVDEDFKDVEHVAEYLIDVLASYLVDANIEVEDRGRTVIYNIQTEKNGLVIGKHGKIINSLETLAQVMTHQYVRPHVKVIVNVGNYRERRQETLARLARKTADQVAKSKQPVFLDPLPAAERKIIHAQLARYSYIATHSEGKEPHRYLVVSYKD